MNRKNRIPRKLVLGKEILREIRGAAGPFPIPIPVSGRLTYCGCSGINSCGLGCGNTQQGASCGFGPSMCFCPTNQCTIVC